MEQVNSLRTGQKFKKTEIGEIPVDWEILKIDDCCDILDSQRIPLNDETRRNMKGQYPYYGANGLLDRINDYIFDDNLILVAEDGGHFEEYKTKPIAYLVSGKCWVNNHAHILRAKKGWSREWVFYSVVHKNIIAYIGGGTRSKLNQKELRAIPIPVPPFIEQRKIAEILSAVDEEIDKNNQIIEKTRELKKGLMQELLTRGIGHKKFKKTEIGEIPGNWEVITLGNVAQINMGQSPPSADCFDYKNGLPFFQGTAEFGTKYPTVGKWCNSPRKVAAKGNILVSVRAPVGNVNLAPEECCIGRGLAAIHGTESDNNFLYFVMNFVKNSLVQIGQGSTFEAINKNVLLELKFPCPPMPEQKKIAEILSSVDEEIEKETANKEKLEWMKKGLMQVLLTGKKRVKV